MDASKGNHRACCIHSFSRHIQDAYHIVSCQECRNGHGDGSNRGIPARTKEGPGETGRKEVSQFRGAFETNREKVRFSEETRESIVEAAFVMGKAKTGALIVVEQAIRLTEYESTGIQMDCLVSSQVLINIFEHNTPLHDGAIIIRGDRIVSATCYLPLSDNMGISKDLGTRHRAAVGMSEVSDALVIVASEETGAVSVAQGGQLFRNISQKELREKLASIQDKKAEVNKIAALWKGRHKHEKKTNG